MDDARAAFDELMATVLPLAKTADSDHLLHDAFEKAGIRVGPDWKPIGRINEAQVRRLVDSLDVKAVWKLASRRVMRKFD